MFPLASWLRPCLSLRTFSGLIYLTALMLIIGGIRNLVKGEQYTKDKVDPIAGAVKHCVPTAFGAKDTAFALCVPAVFGAKTLPLPCVFRCLCLARSRCLCGKDTAFALCVPLPLPCAFPLPLWLKTLPLPCVFPLPPWLKAVPLPCGPQVVEVELGPVPSVPVTSIIHHQHPTRAHTHARCVADAGRSSGGQCTDVASPVSLQELPVRVGLPPVSEESPGVMASPLQV